MSNFFNPGSAKFRRGVFLASLYSCSVLGITTVMSDFGSHEHVFTPVQAFVNKQLDLFYDVKHDELYGPRKVGDKMDKPFFSMRRVDYDADRKEVPPK
jgi:hypothetical protein